MDNERLWNDPIHLSFIESLNGMQLAALWELLVVATFADDELSIEERRDLAEVLRQATGFESAADLTSKEVSAAVEQLYLDFEEDSEELLESIAGTLGSDAARRGAFRTAAQLVKSDGLVESEVEFIRQLGTMLGLEPEVIEFGLQE